ncbi:hypothetical protein [Streptomyces sp. NPDC057690]|uniref:hypothetical protein n=1 Tax=Streptomyces sp. NPDC057690 TaxID=3346214 RepID=UPI0036D09E99
MRRLPAQARSAAPVDGRPHPAGTDTSRSTRRAEPVLAHLHALERALPEFAVPLRGAPRVPAGA